MNEDKLLHELARLAEEDQEESYRHFDERWDRLADGTLAADQAAELRADAGVSSEAREAFDAFHPLDADFKSQVLEALKEQAQESPAPARKGRLLAFPRRSAFRFGAGLAAVASAAAAVLLLMRVPGELPEIPGYELGLAGGRQPVRSDPPTGSGPAPPRREAGGIFAAGDYFELVLRPATAVEGPVAARLFLVSDGRPRRWDAELEVADGGSLRLAGELGRELEIEPGEWTLWAAVGRPEALPGAAEVAAVAGAGGKGGRDWRLLEARFEVLSKP